MLGLKSTSKPQSLASLEARVRFLGSFCRFLFCVLCITIGFLVIASSISKKNKCLAVQNNYKKLQELEASIQTRKQAREIELYSLKNDPAYLELQARDRLNYYRKGEKIFYFGHSTP